ncbi:MAG: hypothetical protein R2822_08390 [Spirosomataceae bacterium]
MMEIPVNYKTITRQKHKYRQLEVGAHPFVVPQSEEDYKTVGLELVEHNNLYIDMYTSYRQKVSQAVS